MIHSSMRVSFQFLLLDCTKEEHVQSVPTLEAIVHIPATDMSLANPKSPTLATTLASTKNIPRC